jgi:hypothetical protein
MREEMRREQRAGLLPGKREIRAQSQKARDKQ